MRRSSGSTTTELGRMGVEGLQPHTRTEEGRVTWRGPRTPKDPLLDSAVFRANRAQLKRLRLPCAICGRAIDYTQPGAFVAGHIVSRRKAKLLGWTAAQINALSNLRTECKPCSNKTGAREGQQAQRAKLKQTQQAKISRVFDDSRRIFDDSRDW
jgi:5-methylcytosine-specific restriction endonuclease McrA